jgi:hypothetical protein
MQGQRDTQSSDAAPGNEDRSTIHGRVQDIRLVKARR